jgi:intracellular multiplication protein IcmE
MAEDEKKGLKGGLTNVFKDSGSKKMMLFVGVAIAGTIGYVSLSPDPVKVEQSKLRTVPTGGTSLNSDAVNPAYEEAMKQADAQRIDAAKKQSGSAMRSLVNQRTEDQLPISLDTKKKDDKDDEIVRPKLPEAKKDAPVALPDPPKMDEVQQKADDEARRQAQQAQTQQQQQQQVQQRPVPMYDPNLAQAMQRQMEEILQVDNQKTFPQAMTTVFYQPVQNPGGGAGVTPVAGGQGGAYGASGQVGYPGVPGGAAPASALPVRSDLNKTNLARTETVDPLKKELYQGYVAPKDGMSKIKLPIAGSVLYAELVSRANSDAPGPILARLLQGPYAGSTVIGTFQTAQDSLVITFKSLSIQKTIDGEEINESVPINAVAVDTKYIGTALATDVDHHLFSKVALGFATAFVGGLGEAVQQSGQTVTNTPTTTGQNTTQTTNPTLSGRQKLMVAGGKAFDTAGQALSEIYGKQQTTVIVESGTPIGLLFM